MAMKSLQQVLGGLDHQESWKGRRQFQQLLLCWGDVVGSAVAAQTRPIAIQRKNLSVATSSSAWAQNLAFERHRILEKLNDRLALDLTDIRFSTAQWHTRSLAPELPESTLLWKNHPSRIGAEAVSPPSTAIDPQSAFRDWARSLRSRSQNLPLCPTCQCPTPTGELERWSVCSLCAAKEFGHGTRDRA
ncbi:MAG TPA: DciA family protein [Coleofasciculaceae cyanobacterium]|jgi:predicted nucleic acid-binding Zn ribbon protein